MIIDATGKTKSIEVGANEEGDLCRVTPPPKQTQFNIPGDEGIENGSRPGQQSTDMAQSKCLYEIPYRVTREIVMSMDADKSWESLAGEIGYSFDRLKHFELEYQKYCGSPTKALLWDWGSRNATVKDLYNKLKVLKRSREMKILDDYVCGSKEKNICGTPKSLNLDDSVRKESVIPVLSSLNLDDLPAPPPPRRQVNEAAENEVNFNKPKGNNTKTMMSSKIESSVKDKQYDNKKIPGAMLGSMNTSTCEQHRLAKVPQESISVDSMKASESTDQSCDLSTTSSEKSDKFDPLKRFETLKLYMEKDNMSLDDAVAFVGTPIFEYQELNDATNGFSTSHKLGAGAFGTVYKGRLRSAQCAIKRLEGQKRELKEDNTSQLRSELAALLRYRHENIVNLYGYASDGPSLCLVYQFMVNGSLEDRLQCKNNTPALPWFIRINVASGAAKGLHFLHSFGSKPLIHGDIKSANILLDKHMEAKIGDLGQAQHANSSEFTGKFTHITQKNANSKLYATRAYLAPEVERGSGMSTKSDVFALGVVFLEICSGQQARDERREGEKLLRPIFQDLKEEAKGDEEKLCREFRDKRGGECPESLVISLISAADRCTREKKRDRIEMEKLIYQLEDLEDKVRDIQSTSMSPYVSVQTHHLSHVSGDDYSAPNLTAGPVPGTGKSVDPAQQTSLSVGHSKQRVSGSNHQPPSPVDYYKGRDFDSLPEALKLQMIADARKEGKEFDFDEIAKYKAMNKQREASEFPDDPDSDPKKMEEIQKYNEQFQKGSTNQSSQIAELVSDPRKLADLKQFDKEKAMTPQDEHEMPAADPNKIKKMAEYDRQWSSGPMHSGLLYGDQANQTISSAAPGYRVASPSTQGQTESSAAPSGIGSSQALRQDSCGPDTFAQQRLGQLNISQTYLNHGCQGEPVPSGPEQGDQSHVSSASPFNSGHYSGSGSYFSDESHPTMVQKDLLVSYIDQQGISHVLTSPHSQSVPPGGIVMEVCEGTTPMAKFHRQIDSYSVPRQETNTQTSEHITYASSIKSAHSLPSENTSESGSDSCSVTDVLRSASYSAGRRSVNPAVRQSEGFQYTGYFDHSQGQNAGTSEYGGHVIEGHIVEGEDHIVEGEGNVDESRGHIVEGQGHLEFDDSCEPMTTDPNDKMKNFFDAYNMYKLQIEAGEAVEEEEQGGEEGQGEEREGEEDGDDSITQINV